MTRPRCVRLDLVDLEDRAAEPAGLGLRRGLVMLGPAVMPLRLGGGVGSEMTGAAGCRSDQPQGSVQRVDRRVLRNLARLGEWHEDTVDLDQHDAVDRLDVERAAERGCWRWREHASFERLVGAKRLAGAVRCHQPHVVKRVWNESADGRRHRVARVARADGLRRRGMVVYRSRRARLAVAGVQSVFEVCAGRQPAWVH